MGYTKTDLTESWLLRSEDVYIDEAFSYIIISECIDKDGYQLTCSEQKPIFFVKQSVNDTEHIAMQSKRYYTIKCDTLEEAIEKATHERTDYTVKEANYIPIANEKSAIKYANFNISVGNITYGQTELKESYFATMTYEDFLPVASEVTSLLSVTLTAVCTYLAIRKAISFLMKKLRGV